jgi:hypothetical protein
MDGESIRRRLTRLVQPTPGAEVEEELAFHLEERARELESRGLSPEEARAAARERLGDLERVKEECTELLASERRRETRREWLKVSWLDFKLGFRMLVKYPGLTIIGALAMAFAIWVGAGAFEFVRQGASPVLPLDEGDRVVGILLMDAERSGVERRTAHDFARWREDLETIQELAAFRTLDRNLITGEGVGEPVQVAEMTASGFDVARTQPLMGRTLVAADEAAGAPPVVVLGHEVWQRRFEGDPAIVGKVIRLGTLRSTVVGVMPEGFQFPVSHSLWMPLPEVILEQEPRSGPALFVFGRLAPGASMAEAQAELKTVGRRATEDSPETHEHLVPRVLPYAKSIFYMPGPAFAALWSVNLFVVMLLVLICGNVALLLFARAATRKSELLVRSALGASRGRIIGQLFVEALVLGAVAALLGLGAAGAGLRWMYATLLTEMAGDALPFWVSPELSSGTVVYSLLLTLLAAAIAGVLPALKVTGKKVEAQLRSVGAGGGGLQFGGVWTAVIVAQIAVTVVFPLFIFIVHSDAKDLAGLEVNFAEEEYLAIRLEMDRDAASASGGAPGWLAERAGDQADSSAARAFEARYREAVEELERRLETRPEIAGVTFANRLPRMYHPHRLIDIDSGPARPPHPGWPTYRVSSASVAPDYFDELQVEVLAGRGFHSGDLTPNARTVVVNESFVENVLGGRNPVGRRLRYAYFEEDEDRRDPGSEPWYEIVGVVPDLGLSWSDDDPKRAGVYHPTAPGGFYPAQMAVHRLSDPGSVAHAVRAVATRVDPALRLYDAVPMDRLDASERSFYSFWFWITVLVSAVAVTLSLAGIYAAMSFAVSRKTREIGIRVALGASRPRIIRSIFRRPLTQVGMGLVLGGLFIGVFAQLATGNVFTPERLAFLASYMVGASAVCLLACILPTRRALAVEPTEALRAEG